MIKIDWISVEEATRFGWTTCWSRRDGHRVFRLTFQSERDILHQRFTVVHVIHVLFPQFATVLISQAFSRSFHVVSAQRTLPANFHSCGQSKNNQVRLSPGICATVWFWSSTFNVCWWYHFLCFWCASTSCAQVQQPMARLHRICQIVGPNVIHLTSYWTSPTAQLLDIIIMVCFVNLRSSGLNEALFVRFLAHSVQ